MKTGKALIIGAGDFSPRGLVVKKGDWLIAADGGLNHLASLGLRPHLVLGDMDSVSHLPQGVARLTFPVKKDRTDMALAILLALSRGYTRFTLHGALGGRLDHSLANLHLVCALAESGHQAVIQDRKLTVYALHNSGLKLPFVPAGRVVSVFAWGGLARGVSLKGLKYPLSDAALTATEPLGVSNEGLGKPARIHVKDGTLLVMVAR